MNNQDNLKSIDSAICPFIVIALTPISVNGLVHLKPRWLIKVLSPLRNGRGVKQRQKKTLMVISKPFGWIVVIEEHYEALMCLHIFF